MFRITKVAYLSPGNCFHSLSTYCFSGSSCLLTDHCCCIGPTCIMFGFKPCRGSGLPHCRQWLSIHNMTHHFVQLDKVEHWQVWILPVANRQRGSLVVEHEYHCSNCPMAYVSTQGITHGLQEYQLHAGSNCSITSCSTCCCLVNNTAPVDYS